MEAWTFDSRDPEQTREAGRELGRSIGADGLVVGLIGPLGAGKTVFVKGLAEGLGVDPRVVSSPTFVIAQQYRRPSGPDLLHHVDLYRLDSEDELESIGFYDMFAAGAVLAVEWADRFPGVLGRDTLTIEFEGPGSRGEAVVQHDSGPPRRRARVAAHGEVAALVLEDWAERFQALGRSRPGSGSFVEMRLAGTLVLAIALAVFALDSFRDAPVDSCDGLRTEIADELGTSHATCVLRPTSPRALAGVGRILAGGRLDLNAASQRLLETLPGIGPAKARAIAAARDAQPFQRVADLERIPGIGPKTVARLRPWLEIVTPGAAVDARAGQLPRRAATVSRRERQDG